MRGYGLPYVDTSGNIVVGNELEQMLMPITAGEEILVGAQGFSDPDLAMLSNVVAGGPLAIGGEDILVGAGLGYDYVDPSVLTGAPTNANAALIAQNRALQLKLQGLVRGIAAARQNSIQGAAAQAAGRPVGTPARVVSEGVEKYRKIPLGINSDTPILAGATRNVTTRPQMRAKIMRLIIENPEWWRVLDIKVGNKSQLISAGALPGIMFSADAQDVNLVGDTASTSQDVIVVVENKTGADHRFEAGFICHTVD